jgi:hypothetical protein
MDGKLTGSKTKVLISYALGWVDWSAVKELAMLHDQVLMPIPKIDNDYLFDQAVKEEGILTAAELRELVPLVEDAFGSDSISLCSI